MAVEWQCNGDMYETLLSANLFYKSQLFAGTVAEERRLSHPPSMRNPGSGLAMAGRLAWRGLKTDGRDWLHVSTN